MERLRQLIHEIHRRSLWQVLGIYLVASWAVLQVVDTLVGTLGLPEWFPPLALALLLVGLPIVLATAFVQEGVSGREAVDTDIVAPADASPASGLFTWRNALGGGVLAFALWGVVATGWVLFGGGLVSGEAPASIERSIAVLPFVNMSSDPDNEYFSDGITEELLNALAQLPGLRVPARTSSFAFKGQNIPIQQIADALGVAYILEGSVRRAGDRVRITAQLVDAQTDSHLWSDTFERELVDIFAVQREIAIAITDQLQITLSVGQRETLVASTTKSPAAYDLYLQGNERGGRAGESDIRATLLTYQQAVALDPGFAVAWAAVAEAHLRLRWYGFDRSNERLDLATEALARAQDLDPDHLYVLQVVGYYHYWGHLNYQEALAVFNRVVEADPNRAGIIAGIGYVERRMGLLAEAAESLRRASELDPLSENLAFQRGETAVLLRRYGEAEQHFRRAVASNPEWLRPYGYLAMLAVQRDGDPEAGRAILAEAVQAGAADDDDPFGPYAWLLIDRVSRDWETATNRIRNKGWDVVATQFFYLPSEFIIAEYQRFDGSLEDADRSYRLAEAHLLAELEERPGDERAHSTLGRVYAGLGDKSAAIEHGERGVELQPVESEAYRGAFRLEELAMIHAVLGNGDEAIELLVRLASQATYLSGQLLRLDPTWDPIRDHPRFQALLELYD